MTEFDGREPSGFKKQPQVKSFSVDDDNTELLRARGIYLLWAIIANIIALVILGGGIVGVSGNMGAGFAVVILTIGFPVILYIESKIWGSNKNRNISEVSYIYGNYVWIVALVAITILMVAMMFGTLD